MTINYSSIMEKNKYRHSVIDELVENIGGYITVYKIRLRKDKTTGDLSPNKILIAKGYIEEIHPTFVLINQKDQYQSPNSDYVQHTTIMISDLINNDEFGYEYTITKA